MLEDPGQALVIGAILALILVPLAGLFLTAITVWFNCYRYGRQIKRRMAEHLRSRQC